MTASQKTALIVGASRGIGLALAEAYAARDWTVIATIRPGSRTGELHRAAQRSGGRIEVETIEMNDEASIAQLRDRLEKRVLDLLLVNAGVTNDTTETPRNVTVDEFNRVMVTNALSPMRVVEALQHLVPADGVIALMSSRMGSNGYNKAGGWEVYRASKAALNSFMCSFAARHPNDTRALLLMNPGSVRTDMGGPAATYSLDDVIPSLVDVIARQGGKPGLRFLNYNGDTIPW